MGTVELVDHYRAFADYNARFNRVLYDLAGKLPADVRSKDLGAFFRSIEATLGHILLADRLWLGRFRNSGHAFPALEEAELIYEIQGLDAPVAGSFDELAAARIDTDQVIIAWIEDLDAAILAGELRYTTTTGEPRVIPMWIGVSQMFNHQTHHRGQVTTLLKQVGVDPGVTDFLHFALRR